MAGGFSEYVKMPAYNFCRYDETLPAEKMAVLTDAAATSYNAVMAKGRVKAGDSVLIVGCGGLGIHALQFVNLQGADAIVVDQRSGPLRLAKEFNAMEVIHAGEQNVHDAVMDITQGMGVDVVIEIVGSADSIRWSLQCLKRNGRLVLVGYDPSGEASIPTMAMHYNEWSICGTRLSTKQQLMAIIRLVEQGKITPVVSDLIPWERANDALDGLKQGHVVGRTVLTFTA